MRITRRRTGLCSTLGLRRADFCRACAWSAVQIEPALDRPLALHQPDEASPYRLGRSIFAHELELLPNVPPLTSRASVEHNLVFLPARALAGQSPTERRQNETVSWVRSGTAWTFVSDVPRQLPQPSNKAFYRRRVECDIESRGESTWPLRGRKFASAVPLPERHVPAEWGRQRDLFLTHRISVQFGHSGLGAVCVFASGSRGFTSSRARVLQFSASVNPAFAKIRSYMF